MAKTHNDEILMQLIEIVSIILANRNLLDANTTQMLMSRLQTMHAELKVRAPVKYGYTQEHRLT